MRSHHLQISILLALPAALCSPVPHSHPPPLPLVIWHGLGDTFSNPGLQSIADIYTSLYPTAQTHIISLTSSPSSDRTATFLGHLPTQVQSVCDALLDLPAPFSTSRLNLLGLSQGGQFLRALVQTCPLPHPPATLITLGSQHNGISRFLAKCSPGDWTCKSTTALLERNKWSNWSQHNLIPAQYFRDPADLDSYLTYSGFLADVNNERAESRNATFADRLSSLDRFVMYVFGDDKTVWPMESGWFDEVEEGEEEGERTVVKLREREMYKEDWLGLRKLDEKGGLIFGTLKGEHMRLEDDDLMEMFKKYYSPSKKGEKQKEEEKQEEERQRDEEGGEEEL